MFKRFFSVLLAGLMICVLAGCGGDGGKPSEKLNGTWTNDAMTVSIDLAKGSYEGVAMGQQFKNTVKILEEKPEYVVLEMTGDNGVSKVTAQFQSNGDILLAKEGSPISVTLKKK